MKIGEFIQKHMNEKKINQAELARRSGVPASTISSIINRNNDRVAIEMMLKLCEILECDIEEYINSLKKEQAKQMPSSFTKKYYSLDEYGKKTVDVVLDYEYERCTYIEESEEEEEDYIRLSCSLLKASAGVGDWLDEEQFDNIKVKDTPEARKADMVIEVDGHSMEPDYCDGDKVLVRLQPAVEIGDIGIFIIDNNGYIKQYAEDRLISLNPEYDDIYPTEYSDFRCVGKVIGIAEEVPE